MLHLTVFSDLAARKRMWTMQSLNLGKKFLKVLARRIHAIYV